MTLREEIATIRKKAGKECAIKDIFSELENAFCSHMDELKDINLSTAIRVTDKGCSFVIAIREGQVLRLADNAPVDVTISGTEENILGVLSGKVSAPKALLFRKIQIQGDIGLLSKLGKFL